MPPKVFEYQKASISREAMEHERQERIRRAAPDLLGACRLGGVGYSANILLWNVAGVLKELGEELSKENLIELSTALRHKAETEWAAIRKAEVE